MAARQLSGARSQWVIALMTASFASGQMIGPVVAGVLFERLGSLRVPSLVAAIALVTAAGLVAVSAQASVANESKP
jgi:MFS family permease